MVSEKQLRANRKNALRSTGPKTQEGKEVIKYNALKHGILSKEVVIRSGKLKEDPEEFTLLLSSLIEDYKPEGVIEHALVEEIAGCLWRKKRVLRVEVANLQDIDVVHPKTRSGFDDLIEDMGDLKKVRVVEDISEKQKEINWDIFLRGRYFFYNENLIRYETTLDRKLYNAVGLLCKLQSIRLESGFVS